MRRSRTCGRGVFRGRQYSPLIFRRMRPPRAALEGAPIRACRDPTDDKFLEVAVHGEARAIITGDAELLDLDPFHGIRIVRPADFLRMPTP
jgi:hypothetical protein